VGTLARAGATQGGTHSVIKTIAGEKMGSKGGGKLNNSKKKLAEKGENLHHTGKNCKKKKRNGGQKAGERGKTRNRKGPGAERSQGGGGGGGKGKKRITPSLRYKKTQGAGGGERAFREEKKNVRREQSEERS